MDADIFHIGQVLLFTKQHLHSGLEFQNIFLQFSWPSLPSVLCCELFWFQNYDPAPENSILLL